MSKYTGDENMRTYRNGQYIDLTPEETSAVNSTMQKQALTEKSRPLSADEVNRLFISRSINTLSVDDNTALRMKEYYPTFESIVGQTIEKQGFKFTYADKLWATVQPNLLIQAHYPPSIGTESLYTEVCETHTGEMTDPIPYNGNMALESGKYYHQDYVIYLCTRDTVNPVYHTLSELVGLYVEKV